MRIVQSFQCPVFFGDERANLFRQRFKIHQVADTQTPAAHFVFISGADAARGGSNFPLAQLLFNRGFQHAVIRQDQMTAVGNEKTALNWSAENFFDCLSFFEQSQRIENDSTADDA